MSMGDLSMCPWCSERIELTPLEARLPEHRGAYMYPDVICPCSGLTLDKAKNRADESIMHHVATGE